MQRERQAGDQFARETRYYLSSLPLTVEACGFAEAVRSHWGIENSVHWLLDVAFREDACCVHKDHAPANLAQLRRIALNLLRQEASGKLGLQGKRRRAGWDEVYLVKVLNGHVIST